MQDRMLLVGGPPYQSPISSSSRHFVMGQNGCPRKLYEPQGTDLQPKLLTAALDTKVLIMRQQSEGQPLEWNLYQNKKRMKYYYYLIPLEPHKLLLGWKRRR
jgi:hypothetical protein